ncbi:MAG: hypothetical protein DCE87_10150 [Betaproteobacteria bacterium]|nr:MAG: hypothetical protein DCE87_10150 [Betaproteobacteria bacterium]PZO22102.1 MAG: hypothetical protein DCE89_12985 [Betaproteobacteria bacterium]PZO31127.1 MAG: hypothetical protein DCE88_04360 [Betaproteobacteria bacterium]
MIIRCAIAYFAFAAQYKHAQALNQGCNGFFAAHQKHLLALAQYEKATQQAAFCSAQACHAQLAFSHACNVVAEL